MQTCTQLASSNFSSTMNNNNNVMLKASTVTVSPLPINSQLLPFHHSPKHLHIIPKINRNSTIHSSSTSSSSSSLSYHAAQLEKGQQKPHLSMPVDEFYLPPLEPVLPAKYHPHHLAIASRVNDWLLSWRHPLTQLQEKILLQTNAAGLATSLYPNADPQAVERVAKLITWILHFDDIVDGSDHHKVADDDESLIRYTDFVRRVLQNPNNIRDEEIGDQPERNVILCLQKEFKADMTPRIYRHHVDGMLEFLHAEEQEAEERNRGKAPDVASYITNRRESVMFHHMHITLEYCMGIDLSDEIMEIKGMKELHDAAADHVGWTNDVISFRKEYYNGEVENLPSVVWLEQQSLGVGGGFQSAMNRACEMIRERERDFIHGIHQILLCNDATSSMPNLLLYLQNLPYVLSGHLEWLYTSGRYHGVDNQHMGNKRHGLLKMDPKRTIII